MRGFSLVELSIVLVILGLLTGGILAGQSLIRAAELRAAVDESSRYMTATQTFRDKYFSLPGDFIKAEDFWGTVNATAATCKTNTGTGTQTCNGDGSGLIDGAAPRSNEVFRFWQHLANAGLIEGTYSGIQGPLSTSDSVASNSPVSKVNNGLWVSIAPNGSTTVLASHVDLYEGSYGNALTLGTDSTTGSGQADGGVMTSSEMWNLDTKLDDGRPAYGKVVSRENRSECVTSTTASTAEYKLSSNVLNTNACVLIIRNL